MADQATLTVSEAVQTYQAALINIAAPGPGICPICWTFKDPAYPVCIGCNRHPENHLDVMVPISYSEHLGQLHLALRNYKDGGLNSRRYAYPRIAAILWRFLELHELCVAQAGGVTTFDSVVVVPSSDPQRDAESRFRSIVSQIEPTTDRLEQALRPSGDVTGRDYDLRRYEAVTDVAGKSILLLDDTWTAGGHAQSAAGCLRAAGASNVSMIVIGRHVHPTWEPVQGSGGTVADELEKLKPFDWESCAVH